MTMITPSYLGETIEYSSLHACRSTLEDPTTPKIARPGFTLVELLIALAIMVTLATFALAVLPDALSQDRTSDAANLTRQWLMVAKARAGRDQLPRGVRLVANVQTVTINSPSTMTFQQNLVNELQFIESPPPFVPANGAPGGPTVTISTTTPGGAWTCQLPVAGFTLDQLNQIGNEIVNGATNGTPPTLALPQLGSGVWPKVSGISPLPPYTANQFPPIGTLPSLTLTLQAGTFDQSQLGAGTVYSTPGFAFYFAPRPLLGEPTLQLPTNSCIDLTQSTVPPAGPAPPAPPPYIVNPSNPQGTNTDADILFAPNGQVIPTNFTAGAGQIFLWVRDFTKTPAPLIQTSPPSSPQTFFATPFQQGGEQQIVTLKTKSGGLGVFPIAWPDTISGTAGQYTSGDRYTFARSGVTSP